MPTFSALDTALTNLVAAITAEAVAELGTFGDDDMLISEGPPARNQPNDLIVVGEEMDEQFSPHAMRGDGLSGSMHNDFRIGVVVDCFRGGDDFRTTRQRATALVDVVDAAVRKDMSLAGAVYLAYPATHQWFQEWDDEAKGTRVRCVIEIRCQSIN